jgi:hypothetical protein
MALDVGRRNAFKTFIVSGGLPLGYT